ncbi:MAG TPA: beta-propeller domain-containing protein [Longimicrobium sp.]|nr:beta-propeller domain-containing protein [Longimicrobium sp.]
MKRILVIVLAAMALPAAAGAQRSPAPRSTLPTFRSNAELARFVEEHDRERGRIWQARRDSMEATRERQAAERRDSMEAARERQAAARRDSLAARGVVCGGVEVTPAGAVTAAGDTAPAVVWGRVLGPDGQPVAGATVRVDELGIGAVSGADGGYRLVVPRGRIGAGGSVSVRAAALGGEASRVALPLATADSARATFRLCAATLNLEGIVASATAVQERAAGITNVQHAGVDEGGIVKAHGEHLVILRRGRLFTVRIGSGDLRPVSMVDAYGPGIDGDGAWYDEMLLSGNVVIVIGYSYSGDGTEINLFRIDGAGRLRYASTYHLRSDDYYSSRNYASRLVDGKLVFYTPLHLSRHGLADEMPALRRWRPGGEDDGFRPIASARRLHRPARPLDPETQLALHTVTVCDVARAELACEATGVLGPAGHAFYVSHGSVFVWTTGWRRRGAEGAPAIVYRIPLDGSAPSALGAAGSPVDQFSFLESDDGHLNVLVRSAGMGGWMWAGERAGGGAALLRVPLSRFGDGRADAPRSAYRELPAPPAGPMQNRFVGRHLLYGSGRGWWRPRTRSDEENAGFHAVDWRTGRLDRVALAHGVDRIEAMGGGAVVVGADSADLHFTAIRLSARPAPAGRYTLRDATQGETRSHGFFYRPDGAETGVLGLPVRGPGAPGYEHLVESSASILFLRNRALQLEEAGALPARVEGVEDDGCKASCVDWYGNARPIFLDGRVFALLGYELVEGEMRGGRIHEIRRATFAPRAAQVATDR